MPQLIALGLIGGVVWFGWRALKKEMARINAETRSAEKEKQTVTSLRQGKDGVYRVEKDD
ncbi:MAG: hypothetical protein JJ891_05965 [Rhizobiaceae bacterium]|jgi:threonine/homoserine/homoserine lactone efflux protein|nr:hypothetical protein [Rhizobiaceae bacterium]